MARQGTFRNFTGAAIAATAATFKNLGTVIPVLLVMALISASGFVGVYEWMGGGSVTDQSTLIKVSLSWSGLAILQELLLGPIVGAIAVYIGRLHSAGQSARLYDAVNFALGRYKRLFLPRLIAQLSIQIGLILLLFPGIIYVSMYAFVDSVACVELKVWPLDRSKALTRGRRGSIVMIYLPVALVMQAVIFAELWALQQGVFVLAGVISLVYLAMFIVNVSFYKLYEGRTQALAKPKAAPDDAHPGGTIDPSDALAAE